ncbi:GspE/PulE family protein [Clostridium sp.]|uniref:GspE/PulE family protein n=1 Tax=Clostridium sp. TaxID=1506 RepID=UPI003F416FD6
MVKVQSILESIDLKVGRKINKKILEKNSFLPIKEDNDFVYVLATEFTEEINSELNFTFRKACKTEVCSNEIILEIIEKIFSGLEEDLESMILKKAISLRASDIHIEPRETDVLIRIRVDGILEIDRKIFYHEYAPLISKIKLLAGMDITEKRKPQDGKYSTKIYKVKYDLRISTIPTVYGEKMVIRILYGMVLNYSIDNLNLSKNQIKKLRRIISLKNGLVIVNGPTGSGKSTTLYAILQEINNLEINITTLEDPIEVVIPGTNQMSLNAKLNIDFATGLRNILRQDPDVIMVGEVRDEETAEIAVSASLTGHKVYTTIHSKTPRDVFLRLEDMNIKEYLIRDSIVGIISQRLIRILCDDCKVVQGKRIIEDKEIILYKGEGCSLCNHSGYKGRKMISEIKGGFTEINSNIFQEINGNKNEEMIDGVKELFFKGEITLKDYNSFVYGEGLNEAVLY